ncbi:OLC1v1006480C1 [Oldenlandia corymbosa var. corymbosa]|uniref:OLC1v1006480C1 n=1 Tax=Oldenlandia corymbosa var. corymbosa TaxID=529605 RepID=A0AAV1DH42_OLDCO|nr:OLC1v1006480C1 [Oldenlandia corymbosa var. corymbosa]
MIFTLGVELEPQRWVSFSTIKGLLLALDHSRRKQRRGNRIISSRSDAFPPNVVVLSSHLLAAFSGGRKASRKYLLKHLPKKCHDHELEEGRKASAAEASNWLAEFLSLHPDSDDSLSLGGTMSRPSYDINDISVDKAIELAKRTLGLGVYFAHESLECVSGEAGYRRVVSNDDIVILENQYLREVGLRRENLRSYTKSRAHCMESRRKFHKFSTRVEASTRSAELQQVSDDDDDDDEYV